MHLRKFPHYYVKDGERRAVFYSVEARDLRSLGWEREDIAVAKKEATIEAKPKSEPEVAAEPDPDPVAEKPNFDFMTKVELLEYALDRGVDLPNNALKAELIEACKAL
jgi:hypothetical protein